jgi:hypothetical protein
MQCHSPALQSHPPHDVLRLLYETANPDPASPPSAAVIQAAERCMAAALAVFLCHLHTCTQVTFPPVPAQATHHHHHHHYQHQHSHHQQHRRPAFVLADQTAAPAVCRSQLCHLSHPPWPALHGLTRASAAAWRTWHRWQMTLFQHWARHPAGLCVPTAPQRIAV